MTEASSAAPPKAIQNPILRAAIAHHAPEDLRYTDIAEWCDEDGVPFRIWWRPWTLKDTAFFTRRAQTDGARDEVYADVLIRKALDEHGSKLFGIDARTTLCERVDPEVLIAICRIIMTTKSQGDHLKNLNATPDAG